MMPQMFFTCGAACYNLETASVTYPFPSLASASERPQLKACFLDSCHFLECTFFRSFFGGVFFGGVFLMAAGLFMAAPLFPPLFFPPSEARILL